MSPYEVYFSSEQGPDDSIPSDIAQQLNIDPSSTRHIETEFSSALYIARGADSREVCLAENSAEDSASWFSFCTFENSPAWGGVGDITYQLNPGDPADSDFIEISKNIYAKQG
ncbi:hypothetical protein GCM10025777_37670 [Membranihabitans marinus]|uniref:Uncharacterized protein n=1 Tax=Nesterenkonia rhizosphaerae TaxID=1348272 RepID=A0ABP9G0J1_9MICC